MKILFVSSGNLDKISPLVLNQGKSITEHGPEIEIAYFPIVGKGFWGYLSNIVPLRKQIKKQNYNVIHAHYSFSAFAASLAGAAPMVVSLMGSDIMSKNIIKYSIYVFSFLFRWKQIIVKSEEMNKSLNIGSVKVIPNGVDLNRFKHANRAVCQDQLNWDRSKKHLLFTAGPARAEKNFKLAYDSVSIINNEFVELHILENVPHHKIPVYMLASDVVVLSSFYEGSPNVIKEAMACNCPIVTTDVGDIRWVIGDTKGCYIASFDPKDFAGKLMLALEFAEKQGRTNGRQRIIELGLDSESVAGRIIEVYKKVLKN